jgi:mannose-6-phosphate isomerase-like protein (cupin superfamily)
MQIFCFDRGEKIISRYDSVGLTATRIAWGQGQVSLTCLTVEPGGTIGAHPAPGSQLFMIVTGEGWVAGPDGHQVSIRAGSGVRWDAGEMHSSGTAVGFTAIVVEGAPLALFEPEDDA